MDEKIPNSRSLAQHRVQARRLKRLACFEVGAVVFCTVALYFLIRDGLHLALKLICGLMLASSAVKAVGDFRGYQKRIETIRKLEAQG